MDMLVLVLLQFGNLSVAGWVRMHKCALGWTSAGTLVMAFRGTEKFKHVLADINLFSHQVTRVEPLVKSVPASLLGRGTVALVISLHPGIGLQHTYNQTDMGVGAARMYRWSSCRRRSPGPRRTRGSCRSWRPSPARTTPARRAWSPTSG